MSSASYLTSNSPSSEFNICARRNCSVEYTVSNKTPFWVISIFVKNQKAGTA